jgi:hypothetical protein
MELPRIVPLDRAGESPGERKSTAMRSAAMPRYYFNVCCDASEVTDLVGEACADDVAALSEAMRAASAIVQNRLLADEISLRGWIEVEDERHRPVLRLPLRAAAY